MHYDPNYKGQIFYDKNAIGIDEVLGLLRQELSSRQFKIPVPKNKLTKIVLFSLLGLSVVVLLVAALVWIFTRSAAYTVVLFVICAVYVVGFEAIITAISMEILRKACNDPVDAVCIGYSLSGNRTGNNNYGGRIAKAPVFQYEYHGFKYTAFDGIYDNISKQPAVSQKTKILVNPSDPEDIVWNFNKNREIFLILGGIFAIVFCSAMLLVVHGDEKFMNSVIPSRAAAVAAEKEKEAALNPEGAGSENASDTGNAEGEYVIQKTDDGKIIMDEGYMKNKVWSYYPDSSFIVKRRKVTKVEDPDGGDFYILYFDEDPDFTDSEWYFTKNDVQGTAPEDGIVTLTEEVKNAKPGDEFIYTEVTGVGAAKIFSTKEFVLADFYLEE